MHALGELVHESEIPVALLRPREACEARSRSRRPLFRTRRIGDRGAQRVGERCCRAGFEERDVVVGEVVLDHGESRRDGRQAHVHVFEELDGKQKLREPVAARRHDADMRPRELVGNFVERYGSVENVIPAESS